jgi:D-3-phosphoglycerate dehydrogenase
MKQGVTIVNTERGDLIDEEAMIRALEGGKVWSVGLDCF